MKILVYSKYFNFKNTLEKPRIETFVVELYQIRLIAHGICRGTALLCPYRLCVHLTGFDITSNSTHWRNNCDRENVSQNQFVIIFEYIVTAVQINADSLGDNSPSSRVQAFLNHCWSGTSNFNVANFLEKQPLL